MSERKRGCEAHQPNSQRGCMDCAAAASQHIIEYGDDCRDTIIEQIEDDIKKFVEYNEYVTIEIDTNAQTAIVVPVGK